MDNKNTDQPVAPIQQMPPKSIPPTQIIENQQEEKKNSAAIFASMFILAGLIVAGGFYALPYIRTSGIKIAPVVQTTKVLVPTVVEVKPAPAEKPPITEEVKPAAIQSPDAVVQEFYDWYTNYNGDPIADGAYKTNLALNQELVNKIESALSKTDPFLCAAKPVSGFEVVTAKTDGDSSSVSVNVKKDNKIYPVKIRLQLDGKWKMANVTCLSADGGNGILENFKQEYGLDYLTASASSFYWNLPDWKGREVQKVNGESLKTENADLPADALKNFLSANGFEPDNYNDSGYKKNKTVCVSSDTVKENGKHDFELKCGEILYYY